jgi:hypothetical protein
LRAQSAAYFLDRRSQISTEKRQPTGTSAVKLGFDFQIPKRCALGHTLLDISTAVIYGFGKLFIIPHIPRNGRVS